MNNVKYTTQAIRLDMLPQCSANDVADDGLMNAVLVCDGLLGHLRVQLADVPHVLFGEFRSAMRRAVRVSLLLGLVVHVVSVRAYEQMVWIATRRVIASMQDIGVWWHMSVNAFIGDSMRAQLTALLVAYDAVTVAVFGASPRPTVVRFAWVVVEQETFGEWNKTRAIAAGFRAIRSSWSAWRTQVAVLAKFHLQIISPMETVK